jgi:hypothetical protein
MVLKQRSFFSIALSPFNIAVAVAELWNMLKCAMSITGMG